MKRFAVLALLVLVAGCRGFEDVEQAAKEGDGEVRYYPVSKAEALKVSKEVMKTYSTSEVKETDSSVIGYFSMNLVSAGSYLGVFPEEKDGRCDLRVVAIRSWPLGIFINHSTGPFHKAFTERLSKTVAK